MKILLSFLLIFISVSVYSEDSNCENAPKDALIKFEKPYNQWLKITCNTIKKAHLITTQDAYAWEIGNKKETHAFNAHSPYPPKLSTLVLNTYEPHKYYFKKAKGLQIAPNQRDGLNRMLTKSTHQYEKIYQLDVLSSTKTVYNFFIFVRNNQPEWILSCHSYNCSETATIKVKKKE